MRVKIQAKVGAAAPGEFEAPKPDYPLRVSSFFLSVGAHSFLIVTLMGVTFSGRAPDRPIYNEFIKPHEHKILFYDFRTKVPDVTPVKRVSSTPDPRGAELSKQAIIAASPKPKSELVFVSVPTPKIEIQQDLSAPLLVAKLETTLPPPPPKAAPKKFVPPPPAKREPTLPLQIAVAEAPTPPVYSAPVNSPTLTPTITFAPNAPPPTKAPEAPVARQGNAQADIAVASLHPNENADTPVPNGERQARFSKAPTQGPASSGDTNTTASLTVPDLTIRQPKPEPPPPSPTRQMLYVERVRIPLSTLSVPLRPASRTIPSAVEARFQGRNVYTMVVPMEHIPVYTGDWIMWFSDRESKPGETPVVRAPVPFRKLEPVDQPGPNERTGKRIQFAATLSRGGRLDGITLLTTASPAVQRAVLQDVTSWEFQPATRNGAPVDVDVVLEIPFNFPTAVASSTQP